CARALGWLLHYFDIW
nr:immunoglobulin heavy chain junction region [Macaca mulatta]MOY18604.1 immunoglobulin heavy chain junction region [Macaca mulatta]MOY19687.1 immunoglobulin heavy chain junction region [Macaca mulatta]MOY19726.1 immunoglobulin heavy chain junction region [Macaca mulatta]MOY20163.1 immunoglobulin heavy chain junction region [Macaca mulatta]